MPASSDATALANALTAYAGAVQPLFTTDTGSYGSMETDATDAKSDVLAALGPFTSSAGVLGAVTVTWRGTSQSALELAAKVTELMSNVGCVNDTDASDMAAAFASASLAYAATGH